MRLGMSSFSVLFSSFLESRMMNMRLDWQTVEATDWEDPCLVLPEESK